MNRRNAMQRVALIMGGALTAPTMAAMLQSCKSSTEASTNGFAFSADYQSLVAEIAEVIIPKTDTPGAKEAGVGPFIETMLRDCYSEVQQNHFVKGLDMFAEKAKAAGGNFAALAADKKIAVVKAMEMQATDEQKANEALKASAGEAEAKIRDTETGLEKQVDKDMSKETPVPFFNLMKELTLFGYFTSEAGCTQALAYVPVPGRYEGCTTLEPGQKAWAL